MRITTIRQKLKGLRPHEELWILPTKMFEEMERVKWFLWHGNAYQALSIIDWLREPLELWQDQKNDYGKLFKMMNEFYTYITNNRSFIPNYGERYRYGERIATGFVESAVNQVVSQRFAKKQQMRWTRKGAHRLLQVRVQVLNDDLHKTFQQWYPHFNVQSSGAIQAA